MGSSRGQSMEIEKFIREVRKTESEEREKIQDTGHRTQNTGLFLFQIRHQTPDIPNSYFSSPTQQQKTDS